MSEYEALAHAYDALLADGAHRRRAAYLHRLLQKECRPVDTVLDLGCGTGTVTCLLAALGYRMTGVDLSEEMLTEAARKAEPLPEDRRPLLLHQSMDRLRLIEPVDAAVSTLDALNYLTGLRAMRETLRRVYTLLCDFAAAHRALFTDADAAKAFSAIFAVRHKQLRGQIAAFLLPLCEKADDSAFRADFLAEALLTWTTAGVPFERLCPVLLPLVDQ